MNAFGFAKILAKFKKCFRIENRFYFKIITAHCTKNDLNFHIKTKYVMVGADTGIHLVANAGLYILYSINKQKSDVIRSIHSSRDKIGTVYAKTRNIRNYCSESRSSKK